MNDTETNDKRISNQVLVGRNENAYYAHPDLITAANTALALQMPLLLTGEAGCGKTDFAWAAANSLDNTVEEAYVRSDTTAQHLLYSYDAIQHFGARQHGAFPDTGQVLQTPNDVREYLSLNALGIGLCASDPPVVLIDEIDKAPRDLPNDLLRELDEGYFEIREIPTDTLPSVERIDPADSMTFRRTMGRPSKDARKPFIIITSNVERQLPDPFLRRCIFYHIRFPNPAQLREIVVSRFGEPPYIDQALTIFTTLREVPNLAKKPATSELINWVEALAKVHSEADISTVEKLSAAANKQDPVDWSALPGMGCLIKLREDRETLGLDVV